MKETTDDNFLGSLKSLVWTAFISVVSFQLLAPQIWSYLHDLLGIGYLTAYRSFTLVYFLLAPVSLLVWFLKHHRLLIKYMPPFNKAGALEPGSRVFIWSFPIFILCQMTVTIWGFSLHWGDSVPQRILVLYFVINLVLLWLCFQFASRFIKGSGLEKEPLGKAKSVFRQSFAFSFIAGLLLFGVAYCFLGNWVKTRFKGENTLAASEAGQFGFWLQQINDTVASQTHNIDNLIKTDSTIRNWHALEVFSKSGKFTRQTVKDSKSYIIDDCLLEAWGQEVSALHDSLSVFISKRDLSRQLNFQNANRYLSSLRLSDSTQLSRGDIQFMRMLKSSLLNIRQELDKSAKKFLGIQLRSVQAKGMLMLISVFFTTLSLYLYFNTISKVQQVFEKPVEAEMKATVFISNRLWLFLTVIAWLLIPIFKPVIDAEINVNAPFISSTAAGDVKNILSGGAGGGGTDKGGHGKNDTSIFIIARHDTTLMLRKDTLTVAKIDAINTDVKDIKQKVSHIENATN